jgi:hypothetical protein
MDSRRFPVTSVDGRTMSIGRVVMMATVILVPVLLYLWTTRPLETGAVCFPTYPMICPSSQERAD